MHGGEEQIEPSWVRAPMCRDIALALIVAHSERYPDWIVDRVLPNVTVTDSSGF
jgi:hypothetical protein